MQEDIYKKLRVSHELRQLLELPCHFWKLVIVLVYRKNKKIEAITTAVCLPIFPKPYLRISVHKKQRLTTPCSLGGHLSKDKWMGKYIAMAAEKCRN